MNRRYEAVEGVQKAMRELDDVLIVDMTFDNAREIVGRRLGAFYKAAEKLEAEYGFTEADIFGELVEEIETAKGA